MYVSASSRRVAYLFGSYDLGKKNAPRSVKIDFKSKKTPIKIQNHSSSFPMIFLIKFYSLLQIKNPKVVVFHS